MVAKQLDALLMIIIWPLPEASWLMASSLELQSPRGQQPNIGTESVMEINQITWISELLMPL